VENFAHELVNEVIIKQNI